MTGKHLHDVNRKRVGYGSSHEHLKDELRRLDMLIEQRTLAFRQSAVTPAQSGPVSAYVSHEEVDRLLKPRGPHAAAHHALANLHTSREQLEKDMQVRVARSAQDGHGLALPQLARIFSLTTFEVETLVICLAPELDRKYDTLYAYLQDDITRKKPSVDLVLDLLCASEAERWKARTSFSAQGPLFRNGLLQCIEDVQSPSGSSDLARFLRIDPRILSYLLDVNHIDASLMDLCRLTVPPTARPSVAEPLFLDPSIPRNLLSFMQAHFSDQRKDRKKLVFHFVGPYGVGKKALALDLCRQLNIPLLTLDVTMLLKDEEETEPQLRRFFREGLLQQAALFLEGIDPFLTGDSKGERLLTVLHRALLQYGWLCFMAGEQAWSQPALFQETILQSIPLPVPDAPLRKAAWSHYLSVIDAGDSKAWAEPLSSQFRLSPGQIRNAVQYAHTRHRTHGATSPITCADLYAACRRQSNQKLHEMARAIVCRSSWEDLILPEAQVSQLKEVCMQVKHRARVFGEWGFDRTLSYGKGLSVLFSGPPGTGKTLAAEVIAHELGLDCYKIDLSGLVSKYIGETEKNLSKIFQEAETGNAILFFDEADALFGKRTDVSDAHDRYANIETSYLLQKMEEYEGIVILATNLRDNMDEAFIRRIRFIVEFPFPEAEQRKQIWKRHFPKEAPVERGIDFDVLSKKVQVSGGNIKNIVLNAAFLAAESQQPIGMDQLIQGAKREYEKIGKLWVEHRLSQSGSGEG